VDYEKFTQGKLSKEEEEVAIEYLQELEAVESADIVNGRKKEFIIASPDQDMTVLEIASKIETHRPDMVIIDGIYLLADARTKKSGVDWKILSNVSRDLKQTAQRFRVPIIGVHQANRNKDADSDELEDVAFADNFARDADILIKCIKIENLNHGTMIALLFSGAREFKIAGFYIHGKPASNFTHIGAFESKEELLSFIRKSKSGHDKSASNPQNGNLVGSAISRLEGRAGKKKT
jgi:replicative DNA helicase